MRRLFFLCIAACSLALSAQGAEARAIKLPGGLSGAPWVLADFDGDHRADLASSVQRRGDSSGYSYDMRVDFSAFPAALFTFHSPSASIRLTSRDLDGDHDRDLVIVERGSSVPLGVWINDGAGHFREGSLADYAGVLAQHGPRAFDADDTTAISAVASHERLQPALAGLSLTSRSYFRRLVSFVYKSPVVGATLRAVNPRGPPPCNS